jgi:hypothetical protein
VVPATKGHAGLPVSGTLHYGLHYSETGQFGNGQDGRQWSFISGDASYSNTSKRLPFTMQYGGGYGGVLSGPSTAGNVFQHLTLSQGYSKRSWNLTAGENVSYTFETPTTGFTGVPGSGDPTVGSGSTTGLGHRLDHATSLSLGGTWGQMRFIDGNGQDMNTKMANAGLTRRLSARNSLTGQYAFSSYDYGSTGVTTQTNSGQFSLSRKWSRRFTTSVAAGPVWVTSSGISSTGAIVAPSTTMLSLSASANYSLRRQGAVGVSYSHGTSGGSGYMLGAKEDNLSANYSRTFGKKLTVGVTGSYMRSASLAAAEFVAVCPIGSTSANCICPSNSSSCLLSLTSNPITDSVFGGVQASRGLGKSFSLFASYTAIEQSLSNSFSLNSGNNTLLNSNANILNGLDQVISFGFGYSPKDKRFKK